ncbi:MAG TPA: hypothetical protein VHJ17_01265 [Thermomonospora sp.]|nr:hypothetical protein [Thermomonospora sp.]
MPYPKLPVPAPGEIPLVCAYYQGRRANWGDVLDALDGRRDADTVVLGTSGIQLRKIEDHRWDHLLGGNVPALVQEDTAVPPVVLVVDSFTVYGGDVVLVVDMRDVPGRGVRVGPDRLGHVVTGLLSGDLPFDHLVQGMDSYGVYQGDGGARRTPTPTGVMRTSFPQLPATESTLLVRTDFTDDHAWRALAEPIEEFTDYHHVDDEDMPLEAQVVDDRAFEHLQPGQVPALVPPHQHTTMVALADATTLSDPTHPLLVVDLYDTPGQATRIPLSEAGTMAVNLELANMDFADFV